MFHKIQINLDLLFSFYSRLVLQRRHKNKVMVGKHLDIHSWLEILSLKEYLPVFKEYASVAVRLSSIVKLSFVLKCNY